MPKDVRRLLLFLVVIGFPGGGFVVWRRLEDRAAEREWAEYCAAARLRGVKLTVEEFFVDPRLAEDENYAASPLWERAFAAGSRSTTIVPELPRSANPLGAKTKWGRIDLPDVRVRMTEAKWITSEQSDLSDAEAVLAGLQRFRPEFNELRSLRPRARAWYPVDWRKGYGSNHPHLPVIQNLHAALAMKARAEVELGRANDAFETLHDAFQLASSLDSAPALNSMVLSSTIDSSIARQVWEGIVRGAWTNQHLEGLQKLLGSRNAIARLKVALNGERALFNSMIEPIAAEMIGRLYVSRDEAAPLPATGRARWWRGNQQWANQSFDEEIAALDAEAGTWKAPGNRPFDIEQIEDRDRLQFANVLLPAFGSHQRLGVFAHATNRMGMIACALERLKRTEGEYPGKLDVLLPRFLAQLPRDPITGNPFQYRQEGNSYVLYSVGINGIEGGGDGDVFMDQREDRIRLPDWVWRGPTGAVEPR